MPGINTALSPIIERIEMKNPNFLATATIALAVALITMQELRQGIPAENVSTPTSQCRSSNGLRLKIKPSLTGEEVDIVLNNLDRSTVWFYDSLNRRANGSETPAYVEVKLRNADGMVLTEQNLINDGFWSPLLMSDHVEVAPVSLSPLAGGSSMTAVVPLRVLVDGLNDSLLEDAVEAKVRCKVFLDKDFIRHLEVQTDWLKLTKSYSRDTFQLPGQNRLDPSGPLKIEFRY